MDFSCSECQYCDVCFSILKWLSQRGRGFTCQQGRRKKKPQSQITDFSGKNPEIHEATEESDGTWRT